MPNYADIPSEIIARLRSVCLALPDAYQEQAWAGTRWRVRKRTFLHVVTLDSEWPYSYPLSTPTTGLITALSLRAPIPELDALVNAGHPFYKLDWGTNVLGMILDVGVDWAEVGELVTESYCIQAPRKLVALVDRPGGD